METKRMCEKCGSDNLMYSTMQVEKKKKHSKWYWICFGWLGDLILWVFLFVPKLIYQIFKKKTYCKLVAMVTCQNCGYHWEVE